MHDGMVEVADVVKIVHLGFVEQERGSDRMNRRIAPSLVEETSGLIEVIKVGKIGFGAVKVHISDL